MFQKQQYHYERNNYSQEIINIEKDAIIESLKSQVKVMDMRIKYEMAEMTNYKKQLGIDDWQTAVWERYGKAYMQPNVNNKKTEVNKEIKTNLRILTMVSVFMDMMIGFEHFLKFC